MQIGMTQKLQSFVKKEITAVDRNSDPFYSWTAGIGYLNHHKYIFVVNDATRCGFILCEVKAKDIKNLELLIVDGIRQILEAELIKPELIERYLEACGEIVYTKTAGRSEVARLNRFTDIAYFSLDRNSSNYKLNPTVLRRINNDYVSKGGGELIHTKVLLLDEFVKHFGITNPKQSDVAIFHISLELETVCTRVLAIPVNYTVYDFHAALQRLFLWKDYHLHKFCALDQYMNNLILEEVDEFDTDMQELSERNMKISQLLEKADKFSYYYDFGDGWETTIELVRIDECAVDLVPKCVEAVGDAPPEDAGGAYGFERIQQISSDPNHEEYTETMDWLKNIGWRPLDIEDIQLRLRLYFD